MDRLAGVLLLAVGLSLGGCASTTSTEERALSEFALRVQRQLNVATDPAAVERNELSTQMLVKTVDDLHQRRSDIQARLVTSSDADHTRERIEIVRIDRQLQMIERLLTRYEQNAPAVARGD